VAALASLLSVLPNLAHRSIGPAIMGVMNESVVAGLNDGGVYLGFEYLVHLLEVSDYGAIRC
jgi:hypothetical protein